MNDLTDFLENGLYDPAFVRFDPKSTTDTLQPNEVDLTYSKYRPDLAALGAKDGMMLSGLAIDDNDPLARRDQGLGFLDVTSQLSVEKLSTGFAQGLQMDEVQITNRSDAPVDTHLLIIVKGLSGGGRLRDESGTTQDGGNPYIRIFLPNGVLQPGQSTVQRLTFRRPGGLNIPVSYTLEFLSGQGKP